MTNNIVSSLWLLKLLQIISSSNANESETCDETLNAFADASANFTSCAIANSRPITLCENCVENFITVVDSYQNMSEVSDGNIKCIDMFVNLDRLQITETMFQNSYNLWTRAKCNECFKIVNSKLTPDLSNETLKFDEYYLDLLSCVNTTNRTIPGELCEVCLDKYITLGDYYSSISNENEKIGVCMDIVDLMNTTRRFWSTECCKYRKHEEYIFLGTTLGIFIITILFYVLTQCLGEKKIPAILQQSRLAESLNHVNRKPELDSD